MQFLVGPPCTLPGATKELAFSKIVVIPDPPKPPLKQVLDACVDVSVDQATLIKTLITTSEGPLRKVIVKGTATITLKYEAAVKDQQIHVAIFNVPFETLVEWKGGPEPGSPICINATVEHFQLDPLSPCTLIAVFVLRFDAYNKPE